MIDCSKEMLKFHNSEVKLDSASQKDIRNKRDVNRGQLKSSLNIDPIGMYTQGSYAMRTMVKAKNNDYDIDDGIYFTAIALSNMSPHDIKEKIKSAVERNGVQVKIKKNCVRVQYPEGEHIDIPVYRCQETGIEEKFELATEEGWEESDPLAITRWFNKVVEEKSPSNDANGYQMRRMVRLIKCFSKSRDGWKNKTVSGFVISVLVDECYKAISDRDDMAVLNTMIAIYDRLNANTMILHPAIPGEMLTEINDKKVIFFKHCLKEVIDCFVALRDDKCEKSVALDCWSKVFQTDFFIKCKTKSSLLKPATAATIAAPTIAPAKTPDKPRGFAQDVI